MTALTEVEIAEFTRALEEQGYIVKLIPPNTWYCGDEVAEHFSEGELVRGGLRRRCGRCGGSFYWNGNPKEDA